LVNQAVTAALTRLLEVIQRAAWHGSGTNILESARQASVLRHIAVLLAAGILTGVGQVLLKQLSSGNGIDTTEAIWFHAGRMPALRTLGSALLSIFAVGMGASMGREGAPKQAGAVFANFFADTETLSDEQRRLLVACGAGAGMAAAYGVPLGGALFDLEVMRGKLALRFLLPALFASLIATGVSWVALPDAPAVSSGGSAKSPHPFRCPSSILSLCDRGIIDCSENCCRPLPPTAAVVLILAAFDFAIAGGMRSVCAGGKAGTRTASDLLSPVPANG